MNSCWKENYKEMIFKKKTAKVVSIPIIYIAFVATLIFTLGGCDMKKNTAFNRRYQALNTRYNVYYNAHESFKKGYKKIDDSYAPDYSHIIPVFSVSDKSTEGVAKGDMTRTIEKCELAISKHSMQKKPKKKYEKMRDPAYVAFYNQEEFNSFMDEVWMLLGQAKYYSNDYLAASATFTYVMKHFSNDKTLVLKASIWKARALKELGWNYEAEEILNNIDGEELPVDVVGLYHGAKADLHCENKEYKEALPHLLKAVEVEEDRMQRTRFNFVIAQIYQYLGQKEDAYLYYDKVIKANPNYQMTFNANILQTEVVESSSDADLIKRLNKLAKNRNNADYLDQIYYAMGNIYLARKDTAEALRLYRTSADTSTRNGLEKAQTLITMADIYYGRQDYVKAQPCYSDAYSLIDQKHDDYERVSKLSQVLDELVGNYTTYKLQDSLLALSTAPKSELTAAVNREIEKVKEEERKEQERLIKEREEQRKLDLEIDNMAVMDNRALGNSQQSTWYFYTKSTVDKGKVEFRRKFGTRRLEDNWNRRNKNIMVFAEENLADKLDMEGFANDSVKDENAEENLANEQNPKRPEYYLKQIPFADEQKSVAHEQLATSLFNMAVIYEEKLQDYPKALETFEEFVRRYPNDSRAADAYYCCYRIAGKNYGETMSNKYRDSLIAQYPDSKYAKILSNPDFRQRLERMQGEQDSIYENTYAAFLKGDFAAVSKNTQYMEQNYPVSSLLPKFMLLNSLGIGKTMSQDTFAASLNHLVERYPNADVVSMAKDILALINQGKVPTEGTSVGGLTALREEARLEEEKESGVTASHGFTVNYQTPYLFKLMTDTLKVDQNKLLYETAMYNFTKFLIKDFEINVKQGVLTVSGLDNYDEALWYINGVIADEGIQKTLYGSTYRYLLITPDNLELIGHGYTLEQYETFYRDSIMTRKRNNNVSVQLVGEEKEIEEIKSEQKLNVKEGDNLNGASFVNKEAIENKTSNDEKKTPEKSDAQPTEPAQEKTVDDKQMKQSEQPVKPLEERKEPLPQPEKADEGDKVKSTVAPTEQPKDSVKTEEKKTAQPKKPLKKYKGLYTYDPESPHVFAVIVPSGKTEAQTVTDAFNKYNSTNQPLLNLNVVTESTSQFPQIYIVGTFANAQLGISYLKQIVKSSEVKASFSNIPYRNIVISKDNYEVLKSSGNITVYMELYKRLYLNR